MMKPQDIIDEIRDDFRVGNVSMPMFIDIWVADDNYGPYLKHRFFEDTEKLVAFMFDLSLSKKIFLFDKLREASTISVNGFNDAVVGYEFHVSKCGKRENESNITPELIEELTKVFDLDSVYPYGWLSDERFENDGNQGH